ncbi:hypothetical protein MHYP_G00214940 [Metynnis hypsauchen]
MFYYGYDVTFLLIREKSEWRRAGRSQGCIHHSAVFGPFRPPPPPPLQSNAGAHERQPARATPHRCNIYQNAAGQMRELMSEKSTRSPEQSSLCTLENSPLLLQGLLVQLRGTRHYINTRRRLRNQEFLSDSIHAHSKYGCFIGQAVCTLEKIGGKVVWEALVVFITLRALGSTVMQRQRTMAIVVLSSELMAAVIKWLSCGDGGKSIGAETPPAAERESIESATETLKE